MHYFHQTFKHIIRLYIDYEMYLLTAFHNEIKILEKPSEINISLHIYHNQCVFKY